MEKGSTLSFVAGLFLGALWLMAPPAQAQLDNYHCYKVKDRKTPKFAKTTIAVNDVFTAGAEPVEAKKPFLFCLPADANGSGINDAGAHMCCYKSKGPKFDKGARPFVKIDGPTTQQNIDVDVLKSFLFCEPCTTLIALP